MNYLTKEQLDEFANILNESPTIEAIKDFVKKYDVNAMNNAPESLIMGQQSEQIITPSAEISSASLVPSNNPEIMPAYDNVKNTAVPVLEEINTVSTNSGATPEPSNNPEIMPAYDNATNIAVPVLEGINTVSTNSGANQAPVEFNGNIFEVPNSNPQGNLMVTTESFTDSTLVPPVGSAITNTIPTTEIPIAADPFFGQNINAVNNPIPVSDSVLDQNPQVAQETMFAQMQNNLGRVA